MHESSEINHQLVLIAGGSTTGKSASLRNIRNKNKYLYLNSEAGKRLPFRNDFLEHRIVDPMEAHTKMDQIINEPKCEGVILDTITFLMDAFETQYVLTADNTMQAWSDYAQFFKILIQNKIVKFSRPAIILGHTKEEYDEKLMAYRSAVPIKGALKNNGVEAYFSTVVATKRKTIKELEPYIENNPLLTITPQEKALGFKHVFQTQITEDTVNERIRSPMGMFDLQETFMDNDAQLLLDRLNEYYR